MKGSITEQFDFSDDSLGIDEILESLRHFLNGDLCLGLVIVGRAHYSIGTMTDLLYVFKLILNHKSSTYSYDRVIYEGD